MIKVITMNGCVCILSIVRKFISAVRTENGHSKSQIGLRIQTNQHYLTTQAREMIELPYLYFEF